MVKVCSPYEVDTKLLSLIHLPVKESRDYYSLTDIVANGHNLDGRIINVLAAVRSVSQKSSQLKPAKLPAWQGILSPNLCLECSKHQIGQYFLFTLVVN